MVCMNTSIRSMFAVFTLLCRFVLGYLAFRCTMEQAKSQICQQTCMPKMAAIFVRSDCYLLAIMWLVSPMFDTTNTQPTQPLMHIQPLHLPQHPPSKLRTTPSTPHSQLISLSAYHDALLKTQQSRSKHSILWRSTGRFYRSVSCYVFQFAVLRTWRNEE